MNFASFEPCLRAMWEVAPGVIVGRPSWEPEALQIHDLNNKKYLRTQSFFYEMSRLEEKLGMGEVETTHAEVEQVLTIDEERIAVIVYDRMGYFIVYNWKTDVSIFVAPFPESTYYGKIGDIHFFSPQGYDQLNHWNLKQYVNTETAKLTEENKEEISRSTEEKSCWPLVEKKKIKMHVWKDYFPEFKGNFLEMDNQYAAFFDTRNYKNCICILKAPKN